MYQESPLRYSPDLQKYKNEWAYLQDLQMRKQGELVDEQKKLEDEIRKNYRQDLKVSIDQHQQIQREQENQRRNGSGQYQSLHDKMMNEYFEQRQVQNEKQHQQCRDFNYSLIEQKKQQQLRERELERQAAEKRIKDAEESEKRFKEIQLQEKYFVKSELLNANHAQEEIKKLEMERARERNKQLAQSEFNQLSLQDQRREQFLDQLKQRYYKSMNNPVQNIYLENHLKQIEDRRNLEKKLVDEYNQRRQQLEAEKQVEEQQQRQKIKTAINSTLKNQMQMKQDAQIAVTIDKIKYHDYLLQKDKEVLEQQNEVKQYQDAMKREYQNELKDQMYHRTHNNKDYMDKRELKINKQVFEANGLTPSIPGMFQDHQRIKQLKMINNCLGYQHKLATPENIQMFSNPRSRFQSHDEQQIAQSLPQSTMNKNSSLIALPQEQKPELYNNDFSSPVKQPINSDLRRNNSVFLQQGKKLFY
ncbi:hypothetical protein ABPG74_015484 [Tetrahymena malaccensis]